VWAKAHDEEGLGGVLQNPVALAASLGENSDCPLQRMGIRDQGANGCPAARQRESVASEERSEPTRGAYRPG
jgi:hypothetical protein